MDNTVATRIMIANFDNAAGKAQFSILATEIISAWWFGLPEGKKKAPETDNETTTEPVASTSTPFTETGPLSDSLQET